MTLTPAQQQALDEALALVQALGPALGPNGALAASIVSIGYSAIMSASAQDTDVTDAQLQALFTQFDQNKADDQAAQDAATTAATSKPQAPEVAPALDQDKAKTTGAMGLPKT